jgi:hypothetical protein
MMKQVEMQFDQVVFQEYGSSSGARKRLETFLTLHADSVDRACKLTEAQKRKLLLAGRGDIKRFFDRYETVKRKFEQFKNDPNKQQQMQQQVWQDASPLQVSLQAGLFHDDSIFAKSMRHTLNADQFTRYEALARDRRTFRHRANIESVVAIIEQGAPLRAEQRQKLIALLASATRPARKSSQYEFYVVMYQIGRLPEEKIKPLFDNAQWRGLNRLLDQYKGIEQWLRQSGQLPAEDDEG